MKPSQQRVLIIGGGPVGLTLAALLLKHNISSKIIEADPSYCTGSRAICLSRRSLEILDWAGAAQAIVAKGLPWTGGRSYFRDEEVLHFDMPHDPTQRFAPMTNIQQFYVEQAIHEAIECESKERNTPDAVQVLWNTKLVSFTQISDGVSGGVCAVLESDGKRFTEQADWLIACDGGRSTVREQMQLPLKGIQYEGRYVIVDVVQKSTRLQSHPVERLAWFDPPSNPGSTVLMHRQPDDVWRIDYQVGDHEDPLEAVKAENVLPRVKAHFAWIGESEPWEPLWISIYNAKCLSLDKYRHERILFAGDAAHLVPIFGVRGLNSGIDDAGNLAWKLSAIINKIGGDSLLDSYSTERRAAAQINMTYGAKSTEFMSPPNHGFDLLRKATLRLASSTPAIRSLINPRQSLPVKYQSISSDQINSQSKFVGLVAPEALVNIEGTSTHLTQFFGRYFYLLCFGAPWSIAGLKTLHINDQADPSGQARERYEANQHSAFLVRPDGYIAAHFESPSEQQIIDAHQSSLANQGADLASA